MGVSSARVSSWIQPFAFMCSIWYMFGTCVLALETSITCAGADVLALCCHEHYIYGSEHPGWKVWKLVLGPSSC